MEPEEGEALQLMVLWRRLEKHLVADSSELRTPADYINIRILDSVFEAQDKGDSRNHGFQDPYVYANVWPPRSGLPSS